MRRIVFVFALVAACTGSADPRPPVTGRVMRRDGTPVAGAEVELARQVTTTDASGSFTFDGVPAGSHLATIIVGNERRHPLPVFVPHDGVDGDLELRIAPPPSDGVAHVWFGGDVMFARRFQDPNADGQLGDALIPSDEAEETAAKVIARLQPFIEEADIAALNLESVVADTGMIHPRKPYTLRSEPGVVRALHKAGIDVAGLGNNHVYDYLDDGLDRMLAILDEIGLSRVGAGMSWGEAVTPLIVEANGLKIALISATSITGRPVESNGDGDGYEPANNPPYYTADPPDETGGVDKAGALRLDKANVQTALVRARALGSDLEVLIVHGGTQYSDVESEWVREVSRYGIDLGVDLVVGHHPHVVQGIEVYNGVPIVFSIGNLIFDQQFVETYPALIVEATATRDGFSEVAVRAIWLDDYSPRPLAGPDAMRLLRRVAAKSAGMGATLRLDAHGARAVIIPTATPPAPVDVEVSGAVGPTGRTLPIAIPDAMSRGLFVGSVTGAEYDLARPLLSSSSFDDSCADDELLRPAGWSLVGGEKRIVDGALRLRRTEFSSNDSTARSSGRVKVEAGRRITLVGRWRATKGAGTAVARLQIHADRESGSQPVVIAEYRGQAEFEWTPFSVDVIVPANAKWAQVQLVHEPPVSSDEAEVEFDDVDLLAWQGLLDVRGQTPWADASHVVLMGPSGTARATVRLDAVAPAPTEAP